MSKTYVISDKKILQIPLWLWPNSNLLSPFYKRVWKAVQDDYCRTDTMYGEVLVDTKKIFPLLLTSQLSTEILGYIWNLANQKYAGHLTEQELYIILALVALAQTSYPFNSLEVLYSIHTPPIPNLDLSIFYINSETNKIEFRVCPNLNLSINSNKQRNLAESTNSFNLSSYIDIFSCNQNYSNNLKDLNIFCEQSSLCNTNSIYEKQNILYHSDTKKKLFTYSTESNDDFSEFQSAQTNNFPIISHLWGSKPQMFQDSAIGSRLANHNLGVKKTNDKIKKNSTNKYSNHNETYSTVTLDISEMESQDSLLEIFPKCTVKNIEKTVMFKDTAIRNIDPIDVIIPSKKNFINSTEKKFVNMIQSPTKSNCKNNINTIHHTLQPELNVNEVKQDLMNLQNTEDKYSALRTVVNEITNYRSSTLNRESSTSLVTDDFGDFVSAKNLKPGLVIQKSNSINLLGSFDLNSDSVIDTKSKYDPTLIQEISDALSIFVLEDTADKIDIKNINFKEDHISNNNNNNQSSHVRSKISSLTVSVPNVELKSLLTCTTLNEQQIQNSHEIIYLKWKQYMKSCVFLLKVALNIFKNITSKIVLKEVLLSAQGYNFLCNLAEVATVCRRINFSHKEIDINITDFDNLLINIDRMWSEMEPFYSNIPIVTELPSWPVHPANCIICALCLTIINSGRIIFNDNNYHITCANLWLNTVNNKLPILRYSRSYIESTISETGKPA